MSNLTDFRTNLFECQARAGAGEPVLFVDAFPQNGRQELQEWGSAAMAALLDDLRDIGGTITLEELTVEGSYAAHVLVQALSVMAHVGYALAQDDREALDRITQAETVTVEDFDVPAMGEN